MLEIEVVQVHLDLVMRDLVGVGRGWSGTRWASPSTMVDDIVHGNR